MEYIASAPEARNTNHLITTPRRATGVIARRYRLTIPHAAIIAELAKIGGDE
jgi:hypothetical protein